MKILILSQFFDPEPTLKGLAFAEGLVAKGHQVEVLTGFPNYPNGEIYKSHKLSPWSREEINGIRINRVALYPSHDRSATRRALTYFSFALSASIIGPWLVKKPDILYVYHPPITISIPAAILRFTKRCPMVLDIQDLWPDTLASTGMVASSTIVKLVGRWAKAVYALSTKIVVLSPGFKHRLIDRGVDARKIDVVYNWNEEGRQSSKEPNQHFASDWGMAGRFNIVYAGSFGPAQALDTVIDAAKECKLSCPEAQFVLIGKGTDEQHLKDRVNDEFITNVKIIPHQTMEVMAGILPLASALLVHLKNDPLFEITIPSKTQAYLATGRPILMGARGDAADLVKNSNSGITFPPENSHELANAVLRMFEMTELDREALGHRGKKFYEDELSMKIGVGKFTELFMDTVASESTPPRTDEPSGFYFLYGKRIFDLIIVIPLLILLSPLFIIVFLISSYSIGTPVTFRQFRAGKGGRVFKILKFRSMSDERDAQGEMLPDDIRTTPFGAMLRRTSIDELPGLFNVLLGQMSLVGPRPLLPEYLPYYSEAHSHRHDVLPGITGAAQINGRQLATFGERMERDLWYVQQISFFTDLKILFQTIPKVFGLRGVVVGQDVRDVDDIGLSKESREQVGRA